MTISTGSGGGFVGKLIFSGFGFFFAFIGSQFVRQEWTALQETKAMQQWVQTACTIESCEVAEAGEDFRLELSYTYSADGKTYTADRYGKHRYFTRETIGEIEQARKRLLPGKTVDGYYNPADPSEAVLDLPTIGSAKKALAFTFIFPAFGLLFAILPWLRGRGKKERAPKKEISVKWFLIPFGSIFALAGLLMLRPMLIEPLQKTHDAKSWSAVEAVVVSSKVKSHDSDDGTTYSPYIAYRYEIDEEEYFGDQYRFMGGSSSGYENKAEVVRRYPKGHAFTVYVNPADPAESVIEREASASLLFGLIPLIFALIGIGVIVGGFRSGKDRTFRLDERQAREHVVMLKGPSPVSKAVGLTLFAIIWNGVVFLIFKSDAPILFLVLFGFFGIVIACAAIHAILAVFNPRPVVEITPGDIRPGTNIAMRWRIGGSIERIDFLEISLKCLKVTTETHRSGGKTSTRIVKTPVYEEQLLHTESQGEIAQGTLQFRIPEDRSPSRPGTYSGIQWQLIFHGSIARWPDLNQELPFTVYSDDSDL